MTEQMVSAAAIREWRDKYQGCTANNALEALDALIPAPTLAEMTMPERRDCDWMQCDVRGEDGPWLILDPFYDEDRAHLVNRRGYNNLFHIGLVTPRPDLSRWGWASKQQSPALPDGWRIADHPKYGRVVMTSTTPNIDGNVHFVLPAEGDLGHDWMFCPADDLAYLD